METFSKKEAFAFGWARFKERPFFLVGLFLITMVISSVSGMLVEALGDGPIGALSNVLDFALQILIGMGLTLILLRVYDRVDTDYTDLVEPFRLFWKYLAMTILVLVIVLIGFILFIIPGIIASVALLFAPYLIIDRNLGPVEALKESLHITHGHRWNLLIFSLLILCFNIFGALAFGIGLLITIPVSTLATIHIYRWLLQPTEGTAVRVTPLAKVVSSFVLFLLIGWFFWMVIMLAGAISPMNPTLSEEFQRDQVRKENVDQIQLANELYFNTYGVFPDSLTELVPEFLPSITTDEYTYTVYPDQSDYQLCTILEIDDEWYCVFGIELNTEDSHGEYNLDQDSFFLDEIY